MTFREVQSEVMRRLGDDEQLIGVKLMYADKLFPKEMLQIVDSEIVLKEHATHEELIEALVKVLKPLAARIKARNN